MDKGQRFIGCLLAVIAALLAVNTFAKTERGAEAQVSTAVPGACCLPDGRLCQMFEQEDCEAQGGTFIGGDDCVAACAGACCRSDGTCDLDFEFRCVRDGGTFQGFGTRCNGGGVFCTPNPISLTSAIDGENIRLFRMWNDGRVEVKLFRFRPRDGCNLDPGFGCNWTDIETCFADLDNTNDVGFSDLLGVLASWGPCPE